MKSNKQIIIFVITICFILSFSIVLQIRTLKSANSPFLKIEADNELRDEVLKIKEKYDNISKQLENSEKKLEKTRKKSVADDEQAKIKQEEIKKNNEIIGLTDVVGQGVNITIKTKQIDNQLKEDLEFIINELKNSGAEAISLNGERLVFNSSIICNENKIEINGVVLQSPFEIKAIGDSKLIYNDLMRPGGYIELISNRLQKVEVTKDTKITIEKYDGKLEAKYMRSI